MRRLIALPSLLLFACTQGEVPEDAASTPVATIPADVGPVSAAPRGEGIIGRWFVDSVGSSRFPAPASGLRAFVDFDQSGFLSHWASCGGAYPAFYEVDGDALEITRREAVIYGKCDSAAGEQRERMLTAALDSVESWGVSGDRLTLTSADGVVTRLSRPTEPLPELGGDWVVLTVDGRPFPSARPARVTLTRGFLNAAADCNSLSTEYAAAADGSFRVTGGLLSTQIGCSAEDHAEDNLLFGSIGSVTGWSVGADGRLTLDGPNPLVLRRP